MRAGVVAESTRPVPAGRVGPVVVGLVRQVGWVQLEPQILVAEEEEVGMASMVATAAPASSLSDI